jgi:hypothetical protein
MFYRLLSVSVLSGRSGFPYADVLKWKNPRATAITFVATVLFIFAARYLNILRYLLKGSYMVLGSKLKG